MEQGEWAQGELELPTVNHNNPLQVEPEWRQEWLASINEDLKIHMEVLRQGYPNRWGARIELKHRWNLRLLEDLLQDYWDKEVVEWLKFGWPAGRLPTLPDPELATKNHKGATDHPEALITYITKEKDRKAVMGPFQNIPFSTKVGISPLSTRPKKNTQERRVILDLSFPIGKSVNDGMCKDEYLGFSAKLTFPKVDELAFRIYQLGNNCCMFKVDLSRYFRQIPMDPGDYSLIGYIINGHIYFDKVLPMGMRSAPYIAQRVSNAIAHIHKQMEFFLLNYVDDFVGAELKERAWKAYQFLTKLLRDLQVDTSPEKVIPPTTRLEFLGITFDSNTMTMEIPEDKLIA